jgi:type II secretory pathway pseudopilin PulG
MRSQKRESGETLVETMISMVLLGLLATGVVAGLGTNIKTADLDSQLSGSESVLRSYAQAWDARPYLACTSSANPYGATVPPGFTPPAGYTASVQSPITVWDGDRTAAASASGAKFVNCPATDTGLQGLTLNVTPPRGPTQTVTITKRIDP